MVCGVRIGAHCATEPCASLIVRRRRLGSLVLVLVLVLGTIRQTLLELLLGLTQVASKLGKLGAAEQHDDNDDDDDPVGGRLKDA